MENNDIDLGIFNSLRKVSQIIRIILWDIYKETSLSPIQIQFINYINGKKNQLATVSEIAAEFDLKKATVTESINNLVKKEIITKIRSDKDKRVLFLKLTEKSVSIMTSLNKRKSMFLTNINNIDPELKKKSHIFLTQLLRQFYLDNVLQKAVICPTCTNYTDLDGFEDMYLCKKTNTQRSKSEVEWDCEGHISIVR